MGFGVWGVGVWGLGFGVWGLGFGALGCGALGLRGGGWGVFLMSEVALYTWAATRLALSRVLRGSMDGCV